MASSAFRTVWDGLLNLVYPTRCFVCDRIGFGYFCDDCRSSVSPIAPPFCVRCHEPEAPNLCPGCIADPPQFDRARAAGIFSDPLRKAIHEFKYRRRERLASPLALLLERTWARYPELHRAEAILPLPLHRSRMQERGFNQSRLLAAALTSRLSLPLLEDVLIRSAYRRPQVGLNRSDRRENVRDAFAVAARDAVAGKSLLLLDDVITTGATCSEAARTLRDAGATEVSVIALAREPYRPRS
jgi:ComF family protein